jgi:phage terminase large subunit-like protein
MPTRCFQVMLHPAQRAFLDSPALLRGFVGGRGAGKSFIGAYDLITKASSKRGRLYMVVAPTYPLLKSSSIRTFLQLAQRLGKLVAYNKTDFVATLDTGSQVIFKSGEAPDRLRGPNLSGLWIDEAQGVSLEAFNVALGCLREDPEYNWTTATFTPRGKLHWTYDRFARRDEQGHPPPHTALFHCSSRDNPFLPDSFVETLTGQYLSTTQAQEIEGEFVDLGGTFIKREWWHGQICNAAPRDARRVRYWDKACLIGSSLVTTRRGPISIQDVVPGDQVLTRQGWRPVLRSWSPKSVAQLTTVSFSNGAEIQGTHDHPVWTENRGWVALSSLAITDQLVDHQWRPVFPQSPVCIESPPHPVPVYDLEVEEVHEFFANGILVHNSTKDGGCYTCGLLMACDWHNQYFIENIIRGQWSTLQRDEIIELTAQLDQEKYGYGGVSIYIEREPGSGGVDSLRASIRGLAGHIVHGDKPDGSKRVRLEPFAAQVEAGNVFLVRDEHFNWIPDYIEECALFPDGKYSDQCLVAGTSVRTVTGQVAIERVRSGDQVWTRGGWREVAMAGLTGMAFRLVTLQVEGGRTVTGTPEHPVWVGGRGFVKLGKVRLGELVLVGDKEKDLCPLRVYAITVDDGPATPVYNLAVVGHNEFLANGILVHNCDASSGAFNQLNRGNYSTPVAGGGSLAQPSTLASRAASAIGAPGTLGLGMLPSPFKGSNTSLHDFKPR